MLLSEIIIQRIRDEGPISFCDFMDMALYYPSIGYYNSEQSKIGKQGDYYTSPVLSSLFGQMIGKQIEEMWHALDKKPFTLIEYGAGTGALCYDMLQYLKNNPDLYDQLKYCIIEKSEKMREEEKLLLNEKMNWYHSIDEIPEINGCILSNEMLDNFPVHKVTMKDELMEVFVDYKNEFIEILKPASEKLKSYLLEQKIFLPANYSTEINLQAIDWIREVATNLKKGFVLTIDYGFSNLDLYNSERNSGTLICYKNHEINYSPYCNIGRQDITAHVNFSALSYWGKKYGLECCGFTTQDHFLRSLGLVNYLRKLEQKNNNKNNSELIFQINKLLMDMGNKFKILIQQKGVEAKTLTGMQFSKPAP